MKEVKVFDTYKVTQISDNSDLWLRMIADYLMDTDEDVMFDFYRVKLTTPCSNAGFCDFISNKHARMRIYTSAGVKKTIDALLLMGGIRQDDKVINIDIKADVVASPKDKQIRMMKDRLLKCITYDESTHTMNVNVRGGVTQISDMDTLNALDNAMKEVVEAHEGVSKIVIDLSNVILQENVYRHLATIDTKRGYKEKGIEVEFVDKKSDNIETLAIYREIGDNFNLTPLDKLEYINKDIHMKTVVMLHIFKETAALNRFGQMGDGKAIISRAALFMGAEKSGKEVYLKFRAFNGDTFFTRKEYSYDRDGAILDKLYYQDFKFEIRDIGYADKFVGRRAHFHLPLQMNLDEYITTYSPSNSPKDRYKTIKLTVPEFIKVVLDDHRVDYDTTTLFKCISLTLQRMKYLEAEKKKLEADNKSTTN